MDIIAMAAFAASVNKTSALELRDEFLILGGTRFCSATGP